MAYDERDDEENVIVPGEDVPHSLPHEMGERTGRMDVRGRLFRQLPAELRPSQIVIAARLVGDGHVGESIAHPDGRIIPFDTFNLFYRDGREKLLEPLRKGEGVGLTVGVTG